MTAARETKVRAEPFFLDSGAGRIFCVHHSGVITHSCRAGVVLVPPFAEEMNKSRRMFSLLARRLSLSGIDALLFDFYGTGDSDGDFGDARLSIWQEDLAASVGWLRDRGVERIALLGLRLGALHALEFAGASPGAVASVVLWQPVVSGRTQLTQFLRIRMASGLMGEGQGKESTQGLRGQLEEGQVVEIGGYALASELFTALDALRLVDLSCSPKRGMQWLEVVSEEGRDLSTASRKIVEGWRESGVPVTTSVVVGEPFWAVQDIVLVPELLQASTRFLIGLQA